MDRRDYPTTAIREALLNAVIHRDYSFSSSILISIFEDRIEIATVGGLVRGISKEDMLLGVSILRNRNLGNVFYRLKWIEAYGTGIPRIMESYQAYLMEPKIETTDNAFKITLFNTLFEKSEDKREAAFELFFTEGEQRVLGMFKRADTIKRRDIEKELSVSQPTAINYLKGLLDKSAIEKWGSGKGVRYRLKH